MGKAEEFQQALIGETRAVFRTAVIEDLIAEAEKRLEELGLKVEDLKIRAEDASGKVTVAWDAGRSHFSRTFELKVMAPAGEQRELETTLETTLGVIVAAFRRFGYGARMVVFPNSPRPPSDVYLEILIAIAKEREFEAFLSHCA